MASGWQLPCWEGGSRAVANEGVHITVVLMLFMLDIRTLLFAYNTRIVYLGLGPCNKQRRIREIFIRQYGYPIRKITGSLNLPHASPSCVLCLYSTIITTISISQFDRFWLNYLDQIKWTGILPNSSGPTNPPLRLLSSSSTNPSTRKRLMY